jgi:hypothetical protein
MLSERQQTAIALSMLFAAFGLVFAAEASDTPWIGVGLAFGSLLQLAKAFSATIDANPPWKQRFRLGQVLILITSMCVQLAIQQALARATLLYYR